MSGASLRGSGAALAAAWLLFAALLLPGLSRPLLWNDEAYTAVYAERVLAHGVPKVHGERNVIYALDAPLSIGVDERLDAYIGSTWGQYWFGALGVLLSRLSDDLYTRTALLRLPFALAGLAGVALFALALAPLLGDARERRPYTAAFVVLCALSISLVLHLREARYYALVVGLAGALVWLVRRRETGAGLSPRRYGAGVAAGLLGLFLCYYPAALAFRLALALDAGSRALRGEPGGRARIAPLLGAGLLAVPLALYFELPRMLDVLSRDFDTSAAAYLSGLGRLALHLLRFEWLAPVLVAKALLLLLPADPNDDDAERERRAFSRFLTLLAVVYAAVVGRTPYFFERYFVVLSPLLAALVVLDARRVVPRLQGRARLPAGTLLAVAFAAALGVKAPEIAGRIQELREPVRGPLDQVIPYLAERHADPSALVVATNYEEPAFVWYLRCQAIVGFNGAALARDLELSPDVVIPRPWQRHRRELRQLLEGGDYERRSFEVANTKTNQIPSISHWTAGGLLHRFRTRLAADPRQQLVIFERRSE